MIEIVKNVVVVMIGIFGKSDAILPPKGIG